MKTICPPGYLHNCFMTFNSLTHALWHMIYDYTLLLPMNQRVLNKLSKEHNVMILYYIILSPILYYAPCLAYSTLFGSLVLALCNCTSCAQVHEWMSCYKAIVVITGRAHCFHDCIYITLILLL